MFVRVDVPAANIEQVFVVGPGLSGAHALDAGIRAQTISVNSSRS
jgi:hypothetical protein